MSFFAKIFVINLTHRIDRRDLATKELESFCSPCDAEFFSAKYTPSHGYIGAALSHAMALSTFLFNHDENFVLILEDDFQVRDLAFFSEIHSVLSLNNWDVLLLAHNTAIPIESTTVARVCRVVNSQTLSGYVVRRSFVPKLIECFFSSAQLLKKNLSLKEPNQSYARRIMACDIYWKHLQLNSIFLAVLPSAIIQRESYSDIENKIVDYGV